MELNCVSAQKRLRQFASRENKETAMWFFKTSPGGYGEHDKFIGVKVPKTRLVAKEFKDLSFTELQKLLKSPIHEDRLLALIILVNRFKKSDQDGKIQIAKFFLKNIKYINNWDLVDSSAEYILGDYLRNNMNLPEQKITLKKLATSKNLWSRRIAILATFHFIRHREFKTTFYVADILLYDNHDLIHKAVGWMIRESANRDMKQAVRFLKTRYQKMPRTMLRYAIEKFPEETRVKYLLGEI
jgi:3-methyladenine DNA glycosylase AlkD